MRAWPWRPVTHVPRCPPVTKLALGSAEAELLRLLDHARKCDGQQCAICNRIDLRIADGIVHAGDDPMVRADAVESGLRQLSAHLENIYQRIEGCPLPPGMLRAMHLGIEACEKIRETLRLPLSPAQQTKAAAGQTPLRLVVSEVGPPRASKAVVVRRAVVFRRHSSTDDGEDF